jgi:hypothetical protein
MSEEFAVVQGVVDPMMAGIAGFVLSLVVCGILGLIFSIMGNNEVKRSNGTLTRWTSACLFESWIR